MEISEQKLIQLVADTVETALRILRKDLEDRIDVQVRGHVIQEVGNLIRTQSGVEIRKVIEDTVRAGIRVNIEVKRPL